MFKSYRVGTVYGIPFKLDITFLLILPVFAVLIGVQIGDVVTLLNDAFGASIDPEPVTTGVRPFVIGFGAAVVLFACVTLHELGHSVVAMYYDYEVESITLWLLGGIAKPAEQPQNWVHEFWIAVAGPLVNIAIAAGCGVTLLLLPAGDVLTFLLLYLALLNVGLAVFNVLPAFPLDGGRILRALLARNRSYLAATKMAASVGKGFALLLGFVGLLGLDFILVAIALFVYIAATSETRQMMMDAAFEGLDAEDVMTPAGQLDTVGTDSDIAELLDFMLDKRHSGYPVHADGEFVGIVTLEDLQTTDQRHRVGDVMTPAEELETVAPEEKLIEAFNKISTNSVGRLPVVDSDGELLGLITRTDLMRAFKILSTRQQFVGEQIDRKLLELRGGDEKKRAVRSDHYYDGNQESGHKGRHHDEGQDR